MKENDTLTEYHKIKKYFRITAAITVLVLASGSIFYHFVEKWDWLDSVYFCVVTLTTIGYGDLTPKTDIGKLFTIFYILIGVGVLAAFVNLIIKRAVAKRGIK